MNSKAGFWSAVGALVGGVVGAASAKYAAEVRPRSRLRYDAMQEGSPVEDAMIIGGAAGAVLGAFVGGAAGASEETPQITK
jgi:hypothetical protein